jgi:phosphate:Na+ symporter
MYLSMIIYLAGGVGLFILGMIFMTDALKTLAGDTLRDMLSRFTGGRIRSIISGIGITAVMQSSHATLITTIGFVSAGLLTFEQSIGIVIGAHIGTTSTGWLVSLLGLKLNISMITLPMLGIGAMLRLLGRERIANMGMVLAGFALIFLGIDTMQTGMKDVASTVDLSMYTSVTLTGRLFLIGVGIVMTVLMQSSSAAMTITLAAVNAGTLSFEQSAALVVGQNIGTTLTAAIAAVGASVPAKRTAMAHILFNAATAGAVFFFLPVLSHGIALLLSLFGTSDPTLLLPAFHTAFNVIGMFIALPFISIFSRFIIAMVPERGSSLTRNIDYSVLSVPAVAIETARRTARDIIVALIETIIFKVNEGDTQRTAQRLAQINDALAQTRIFLSGIRSRQGSTSHERERHVSVLHVIDHAENLVEYCKESDNIRKLREDEALLFLANELGGRFASIIAGLTTKGFAHPPVLAEETSMMMTDVRKKEREMILRQIAMGQLSPDDAYKKIEAIRWLDRIAYRVWRAAFHLEEGRK